MANLPLTGSISAKYTFFLDFFVEIIHNSSHNAHQCRFQPVGADFIGTSFFYTEVSQMAKKKAAKKAAAHKKAAQKEMLVVTSKVKAYIKSKGMMSSSDASCALNNCLYTILDAAIARTVANRRSTVKPQDM